MGKFVRFLLSAILILVIVPSIGEFFVKWLEQNGVYENPNGRVADVMAGLTSSPLYVPAVILVVGLTFGAWLNWAAAKYDRWRKPIEGCEIASGRGLIKSPLIGQIKLVSSRSTRRLDQSISFTAKERLSGVVILGRYFIAQHHLSGVDWISSDSIRVADIPIMAQNESATCSVIRHADLDEMSQDRQFMLFSSEIKWPKARQNLEHILVQITISANEGETVWRKLIRFTPDNSDLLMTFIDMDLWFGENYDFSRLK